MMDFRRGGLLLAVFGLATIPLLLLGYLTVSVSSDAVQEEAKKGAYDTAAVSAVLIQDRLDVTTGSLSGYAQAQLTRSVTAGDARGVARATAALVDLPTTFPGFEEALLVNAEGGGIARSDASDVVGHDYSYLEWYRPVVATNRPYMTAAAQDALGRWVVWIAVPVQAESQLRAVRLPTSSMT